MTTNGKKSKNLIKLGISLALFAGVASLPLLMSGCGPSTINYEGKVRPVEEVEEILSDKLEVENPGLDLGVNIFTEED